MTTSWFFQASDTTGLLSNNWNVPAAPQQVVEAHRPASGGTEFYCRDCGATPGNVCGLAPYWGSPFVHYCRDVERIDCPGFAIRSKPKDFTAGGRPPSFTF
jgi:hypothetical protein